MRGIILYMLLFAALFSRDSRAQALATPFSYQTSGSVYTQHFDGLPATGSFALTGKGPFNVSTAPINGTDMVGWQFLMTAGTGTNASFAVSTGSSTGNGVYSFGSSVSADRALGTLASGSGLYAIGVVITNNTGGLLNRFTINFTAEQWRKGGSTNKNNWNFRYKTGNILSIDQTDLSNNAHLNFSSVINTSQASSLNGNLPENQLSISYSVDSVYWQPGEQLLLRWDDIDESGNDDASGIDNFQFSATLASAKPSIVMSAVNNITASAALLTGIVNDNYATTSLSFEYDSLNTWINPYSVPAIPGTIQAGAGNTNVSALLTKLSPGKTYYYRIKASNQQGSITGTAQSFTTLINTATVITSNVLSVTTNTAMMGGKVIEPGGAPVTERGIVWSTNPDPLLSNNKIMMGIDTGSFAALVSDLPEGSTLFARAYAINTSGISYGNEVTFTTKTTIRFFSTTTPIRTNLQTVNFRLQTLQNITGLSSANFKIETDKINSALITAVTGSGNTFTVTVDTGTEDGLLGLTITNSLGLSAPINNLPFAATGSYLVDKTAPVIKHIDIPDQTMKAGDTITVAVAVLPDQDTYQMVSGSVNDFPLYGWMKKNDSNYTAGIIVSAGGSDVMASANIPVSMQLADATGNMSAIYQIPVSQSSDLIDVTNPIILSAHYPINKLYKSADTLYFILHFNEKINVATNENLPFIPLTIGSKSRSALYTAGSGSDSLVFTYIIQPGEFDNDGIKTGNSIQLNNAKITDMAGNIALPGFSNPPSAKSITVDAVQPKVNSVTVPAAASYITGNLLGFLVNYSEKVIVTITDSVPAIQILIGGKTRNVLYQSGSDSSTLLFSYRIQKDDFDEDGIKLKDTLLLFNNFIRDEAGNPAKLKLTNIGALSKIKINPVTAAVDSVTVSANGLYKSGDTLKLGVNYNQTILADTSKGIPSIRITLGNSAKQALYKKGAGSNRLSFAYIIQPGDEDTNGIKISSGITLHNSSITDTSNHPVPLNFNNIGNTDSIFIDAVSPTAKNILLPENKIYKTADTLIFIVRFNEKVMVTANENTPSVFLTIGSTEKSAWCTEGSKSDSLVFRYIIQPGDLDNNGITISKTIQLNNARITDIAGNDAALTFSISQSTKAITVDAVLPEVNSVTLPVAASYKTGNLLDFLVNYSEKVIVNSTDSLPYFEIAIGSATRNAWYQSGSGSHSLLFRYRIQQDDFDEDGIKFSDSLRLSNASIKDEAGNNALVKLSTIGELPDIKINPVTAVISRVIVPAKGIYKTGDTLECIVNYTEKILVNTNKGIPTIKLTIGNTIKQALYRNGTGTNALVFSYIIQSGDEDTNGITLYSGISLNNGTIADIMNNPAPLLLNTVDNTNGVLIDAVSPEINHFSSPVNRVYKAGDTLNFIFHFSEKITVHTQPDTPYISLTIGSVTKYLHYRSGTGTHQLRFSYIVQKGDQDKNGIRLGSSVILNNCIIKDIAGNKTVTDIKKSGVLAGIQIDGIAPHFLVSTHINIPVCENSPAIHFDSLLAVTNEEPGELINWIITFTGNHGSLPNKTYSFSSNEKTMLPSGFTYIPHSSQHGSDTMLAIVSDGTNSIEKKIILTLQPGLTHSIIGPSQIICTNQTPAPITDQVTTVTETRFSYQWETAGIDDTLNFKKAPGTNNARAYSALPLNNHTWFRRITKSGVCSDTSSTIKITVLQNGLWLGKTDNNWSNAQNWCNRRVPDIATDVKLFANTMYYPAIDDTASCHHLMIANNAFLNITGELKISGDIYTAPGSIQAAKGSMVFAGDAKQRISGNTFHNHLLHNLLIENREGVTIYDSLILSGTVLLYNGSVTTNNQLHLQNNASIGPSASGTSVKGNISLEHKINGGRRCFWLLGHPFNLDTGLQLITRYIDITGEGGQLNGFTGTATNQPSAFWHNPFLGNDTLGVDAGWIPFTHTNGTQANTWKKHSGIRLLVRGKPGQGLDGTPAGNGLYGSYLPEPVMLKISGPVNTGDQEITVRKDKYAGYNIMANPYPSPINLSFITRAGSIGMHYWIWNPQQGRMGGYSSIPFSTTYILPAFGAIIVKANDQINNTILVTENCKTPDTLQEIIPVIEMDDTHHAELRLETDSIFWDRILLLSMDSAKAFFDKNDAEKFQNDEVNFYSISRDKKRLSTDARPLSNESMIALGLQTKEPGRFRIRVMKAYLATSNKLMLHDRLLNNWMHLENDSSYSFNTTTDTSSKGNNRFEIISQKKFAESLVTTSVVRVKITPVPAKDNILVSFHSTEAGNTTIRLLTLSGTTVKNIPLGIQKEGQVNIPVGELPRGIYLIELTTGNQLNTQKMIKY
ncbi:MAG: T9SS type A sorting domain-containing protein [Chitinophagaceae bacterium]|nr:T9SS type A sorting domain-containing protein [Chitinophagaceae bacterium]